MHIPKTAGSSVRHALDVCYAPKRRVYLYDSQDLDGAVDPERFHALPPEQIRDLRLVMGHFYYGLHRDVPGPARYATIVRDPVQRLVSEYQHFRTVAGKQVDGRQSAERRLIVEGGLSLERWVFERQRREVDNQMVRQITGRLAEPFGHCPDTMLAEALEHIDQEFACVLVFEQLADSWDRFGSVLGGHLPPLERHNVNKQRSAFEAVEPQVRDRIRELNRLDDALHRAVVSQRDAATS